MGDGGKRVAHLIAVRYPAPNIVSPIRAAVPPIKHALYHFIGDDSAHGLSFRERTSRARCLGQAGRGLTSSRPLPPCLSGGEEKGEANASARFPYIRAFRREKSCARTGAVAMRICRHRTAQRPNLGLTKSKARPEFASRLSARCRLFASWSRSSFLHGEGSWGWLGGRGGQFGDLGVDAPGN